MNRFVARGDEDAFRQLFRRHTPRLYAMTLRLSAGRADQAEDLVQVAWLRASRQLAGFEWRSSLGTWLAGIAINCAREVRRKPQLEPVAVETLERLPAPLVPVGDRVDLDRAIAALPDGYREVLVLHDVEGLTHDEISTALAIAPGTSKSQLFHARRAVRRWLAPSKPEGERHAG